jgi:steroid delta-isomerase-like uncharacterized protein
MKSCVAGFVFALATVACTAKEQPPAPISGKPVLEAFVAAWNRHDSAAFDTLMTADAVYQDIAAGFKGAGPAEVKGFMRELLKSEPDFQWKLGKIIEEGTTVAAQWEWTATYTGPSPNGPVKDFRSTGVGASVAEIENGRIKRFTDYYDFASYFPRPAATGVDTTKK